MTYSEYHCFSMGTEDPRGRTTAMLVFAEVVASGSFTEAARRLDQVARDEGVVIVGTGVNPGYAMDTLLGVLAHSALAFGLVAVSFLSGIRIDLMAYLFGDILAVTRSDLAAIWGGGALVVALLFWRWQALLTSTLNPDLAIAAGLAPRREQMVLTLTLALVVAMAIKVVGVLLIAALLLIPAASARPFSNTPEGMAGIAAMIGAGSALAGLGASFHWDTPAGPSIVCVAAAAFVLSLVLRGTVGTRSS